MVVGRRGSSISSLRRIAARVFSSYSAPIHGIHVFQCPDVVGIVAKLSECIASRGGNIHSIDVFVPGNKQVFYSRSEFVFDPVRWPRDVLDSDFLRLSRLFSAEKSIVRVPDVDPKYKIAVLASKQDHCLVDLLHRWQEGRLPVEISCVIRDMGFHITTYQQLQEIKESRKFWNWLNRQIFLCSQDICRSCPENFWKLTVKMSLTFITAFSHHSRVEIPSKQAFDAGVKLIGATSHFVTEELDAGPIIEQMVERVSHRDTLQSFVMKSENLEKQCLAQAIKSYCELRVLPYESKKTVVF
ncbi:Formyltetrahydrofolate deformylase 2, mitochondrial [Ananas comosus]|uniref:Formyltetrahydrofolate deformylase 2, mitochondrial n=1 Tax=Ananas comosus TaxID=4615 RepID=A0A199UPH8_ANACO|nr:Formyltetrahydrofolate deformylase 2, mitochondrial [Ananas comosus]